MVMTNNGHLHRPPTTTIHARHRHTMMLLIMLLALNPALNHALASPSPPSAFLAKGPMNKKWTPSAIALTASRKSWIGISPTTTTGRSTDNGILMMVRGGGDITDDSSDEEYDLSSDDDVDSDADDEGEDATTDDEEEEDTSDLDDINDDETTDEPSPEQLAQLEKAQQSEQLLSQSRNYGIATALWASLFFDTLLNNAKRCDLFPTLAAAGVAAKSSSLSATMIPTALLASGFGLASGVSFLLWRDLEIKADMMSSDDGDSKKGDSILSLSSTNNNDDSSEKFASRTRARLCFHLSLFGLLCLGAHAGYYFSDQAPFLGVSAAVINVHNTLTYVSALMKEAGGAKDWMMQVMMWPVQLFQSEKGEGVGATSFLFRLSATFAWMRCIPVGKNIASLGSGLLLSAGAGAVGAATESSIIVNNARQLSLQLVSLARLTLFAGASHMLYIANQPKNDNFSRHPFFAVLSGMLGLGSLGVGGTILFDTIVLKNMMQSKVAVEGALIAMFGLFSGLNSVSSFLSFLKQKEKSSESS